MKKSLFVHNLRRYNIIDKVRILFQNNLYTKKVIWSKDEKHIWLYQSWTDKLLYVAKHTDTCILWAYDNGYLKSITEW